MKAMPAGDVQWKCGLLIAGCSDGRKKIVHLFGVSTFRSVQHRSYSHTQNATPCKSPAPAYAVAYAPISSHHNLLWYTYTPIKRENKKRRGLRCRPIAVVCPRLLSCLWIIVVQSLWCFESKKSRPCWRRRWWPGQLEEQRWRREQRRWSRCLRSSPASRRPAPRWSWAWAFQRDQPSSCWRQPLQCQRHR